MGDRIFNAKVVLASQIFFVTRITNNIQNSDSLSKNSVVILRVYGL